MKTRNRLIKKANIIAKKAGYGRATRIVVGSRNRVLGYTPYGHRKTSDGQYVPMTYIKNFGWKNTYYQHADCVVEVNPHGL